MPRQKKQKLLGGGLKADVLKEFIDLSYKGNTSIAPEGYEIDAPLSDSRVKVYKKIGSNQVIVTHRGSVGLLDWMDNAKFFVAGKVKNTASYKLHRERHLKAIEKYGANNIIGIGHSRAGLYLQELQKEVPIKEIITYNKAVGFYDALRKNEDVQTDVKVKNDFVSLLSGLQKRKKPMVEIEATKNPFDFNKAHQAEEISKLGETFIGKKEEEEEPMQGSGTTPKTKTEAELKKLLTKLEKQRANIKNGKEYKTTNIDKVNYAISYTEARLLNYTTKGMDLIITKKKKYGDEVPAKAKAYKAKEVKPKKEEPKKEEPKKEEPKKEEPKKEEPKKEEPRQNKMKKEEVSPDPSKYKYASILGEVNNPTFPVAIYQSKELKKWIDWLEKLIEKNKEKNTKIRRSDIFWTPESKQLLNELFEFMTTERGGSVKISILLIDDNFEELLKYLGFDNSYADLLNYEKPLNTKNANILNKAYNKTYSDIAKEVKAKKEVKPKKEEPKKEEHISIKFTPKKEEPKKEEPKKEEPKKEEPKKEEPKKKEKSQKQKDFAERQRNLQELENIILNKDADEITELLKSMGFGNANLTNQTARQDIFKLIKLNNASKSKKQRPFNIEEFITRFNNENCEDLMCKYGINSKSEFRKWVVKNHPDKGGTINDSDFKQIIKCAIKEKYCTKKMEGGIFGFSDEEKARKQEYKEKKEAYGREHGGDASAYVFSKSVRKEFDKKYYNKKNKATRVVTTPKAVDTMPKAPEEAEQQGIDETEQEMQGSGFYYLKEISKPTNPIFKYKRTFEIPTFIDPETEFLLIGGGFTDMMGMNCNKEDGTCFNPVWERRKIRSQILSEYKIWYNPFAPPPAGTIRMAWLNPMIEERFKPKYDEFVARRNVNIGLPADASRDRFAQQMFSNITDGLSYIPGSNIATAGLTLASTLSDTK